MAQGKVTSHLREIVEIVAKLSDQELLISVGLVSAELGAKVCEFSQACATRVAGSMVDFAREVLGSEILFLRAYSEDLPNKFCALLGKDMEEVRSASTWLWSAFMAVEACEKAGQSDIWYRNFARNLLWPLCVWCREVLVAIGEMNGVGLPGDVHQEVMLYSLGQGTTKANEDVFNRCRKVMKMSGSGGRMTGPAVFHTSLRSPVLKENDMQEVVPTTDDRVLGSTLLQRSALPKSMFEARSLHDFSLGEVRLREFKAGGDWPSISTERYLARPEALRALFSFKDELEQLKELWQARLVQPGDFLYQRPAKGEQMVGYWVLRVSEFCAIGWRARCRLEEQYP